MNESPPVNNNLHDTFMGELTERSMAAQLQLLKMSPFSGAAIRYSTTSTVLCVYFPLLFVFIFPR